MRIYPPENYDFQEVLLSKTNSFSLGNNVLYNPASYTDGFLSRDTRVLSN
jgi:hypothetical protein